MKLILKELITTNVVILASVCSNSYAANISTWSELNTTDNVTFAGDITASGTPTSISLNSTTPQTIDGAKHSLIGNTGYQLKIYEATDLTFQNLGTVSDGSAESNSYSYTDANGNTIYKTVGASVNNFSVSPFITSYASTAKLKNLTLDNDVFYNNTKYLNITFNDSANTSTIGSTVFAKNTSEYGALSIDRGLFEINDSYFVSNQGQTAGALYVVNVANLKIDNTVFANNKANEEAGAINILTGSTVDLISNSLFANNEARIDGGAINSSGLMKSITGTTFRENSAKHKGGAIWWGLTTTEGSTLPVSLKDVTFEKNKAATGGALHMYGGYQMHIDNATFKDNFVTGTDYDGQKELGGAAFFVEPEEVVIENSTFEQNKGSFGGAVYAAGTNFFVVDTDFKNNSATEGGAMYSDTTNLNIYAKTKDVTFEGNTAANDSDSYNGGAAVYFEADEDEQEFNVNAADGKKVIFNNTIAAYGDTPPNLNVNKSGLTYTSYDGSSINMENSGEIQFNDKVGDSSGNIFNINLYGGQLSIGQNDDINSSTDNPDGFLDNNNFNVMGDATLYTINDVVGTINFKNVNMGADLKVAADADLEAEKMDNISAESASGDGKVILSKVNVLKDSKGNSATVRFVSENMAQNVALDDNLEAMSPIYKYDVKDNQDGTLKFSRGEEPEPGPEPKPEPVDYNPDVFETNFIAHNISNIQDRINNLMFNDWNMFGYEDIYGRSSGDESIADGAWVKVYGFKDKFNYKNIFDVKSKTAMLFLGAQKDLDIFAHTRSKLNVYGGFVRGRTKYNHIKIDEKGEYIGANLINKNQNFIYGFNVTGGAMRSRNTDEYGKSHVKDAWAGVAGKLGYLIPVTRNVLAEPSIHASYTYIWTGNYTNSAGLRVKTENTSIFELVPNMRLNYRVNNDWMLFSDVRYIVNHNKGGDVRLDGSLIPSFNTIDYLEYGVGCKLERDAYDFEASIYRRDGNREGFNGYIGIKYNF